MGRFYRAVAAAFFIVGLGCRMAQAQPPAQLQLDLPAQELRSALAALSRQADVQLLYDAELADGKSSPELKGEFSFDAALATLLHGSGLVAERAAADTILIRRSDDNVRAIGAVRVAGVRQRRAKGVNGSRDVLATENSDRYTTRGASVGSPFPQALKDTPRSVSVLGQPQLRDQGIVELADAMRQLPGASVRGLPVDEAEVRVRAFELTEHQVDGGAVRSNVESRFRGNLDIYDRIELLRGADGLGNGFASPAGLLNLVRKRPLDRRQIVVEVQAGSWDDYRGMLDVSTPLGWDGRLRGRAVASIRDREYFYETAELQRRSAYGIVEADLTPATVLAVSIHEVDQHSVPWATGGLVPGLRGLPRVPDERSFVLPWERDDLRATNLFLTLDQHLGRDWHARLVVDDVREDGYQLIANGPSGLVDAESGEGLAYFGSTMEDTSRRQRMADLKLRGRLWWWELEQRVALNLYRAADEYSTTQYDTDQNFAFQPFNFYDFNPANHPAPLRLGITPGSPVPRRLDRRGASLALDLSVWQPLRVIGAWRWAEFGERSPTLEPASARHRRDDRTGPSYVGITYTPAERWSVYASWADVYESQARFVGPDGHSVDPLTGRHHEIGLKFGEPEQLLATLALFRVEQTGFARFLDTGSDDPRCCYDTRADQRNVSEGVELGLTGAPGAGMQLTANYVYSRNVMRGADAVRAGERLSDETPRHLFQFWGRWRPASGTWARLTLGAGMYAQSESSWRRQFTFTPEGPQITASAQGGYGLLSLLAAWRLDTQWEVALNADNVFDREYDISRGSSAFIADLYGAPRNLRLTLRGTF